MYNFLSMDGKWEMLAILHNLLGLKRLHDAGYNIEGHKLNLGNCYNNHISDVVGSYLEIIFYKPIFGRENIRYDDGKFIILDRRLTHCLIRRPDWEKTREEIQDLLDDFASANSGYWTDEPDIQGKVTQDGKLHIVLNEDAFFVDALNVDVLIKLDKLLNEKAGEG